MLSADAFARFVETYNRAVFPAPVGFYLVAAAITAFVLLRPGKWADAAAKGGLALLWAWVGAVNMVVYYGRVNSAGYVAGALFLLQALYFAVDVFHKKTEFKPFFHANFGYMGVGIMAWGLVVYPLTALILGRPLAGVEFGGAAQLGIFTCGILLFTFDRKPKWRFTLLPFLYSCVMGLGPATQWRRYEDYAFFAAGLVLLLAWIWGANFYKEKKKKKK